MTKTDAKRIANAVVETNRRILKERDKKEISEGWWRNLKAEIAEALYCAAREE